MVQSTIHRGPDGRGSFIDRIRDDMTVGLGHNRLSIIDLTEHAAQPMVSADRRYVLVYNGEVYNYKELAQELGAEHLEPHSCGDTAIVLACLRAWGPRALTRFNGMWGLLFYDREEKTLLVSRDRFGIKPLYYRQVGGAYYFASEIKAILAGSELPSRINPDVAVSYIARGLLNFSENTFFADIKQAPAASYAVFDLNGPVREPQWQRFWRHPVELGHVPRPGDVSPSEIRDIFLDAVQLRLRSDVPVGVLLSGGVDSSSIVGAINHAGALKNVSVLAVTSNDRRSNEEPFIDRMARFAGLTPQKVNVSDDPHMLLDRLAEANWYNDEPVSGIADIAHLRLMERARSLGIKVLLSGQGADEQLGGYSKFFFFYLRSELSGRRYWMAAKTALQSLGRSRTLYDIRLAEALRYIGRGWLSSRPFIADQHRSRDTVDIGWGGSYPEREWRDLSRTSVPTLLHYEDRMSMSQSLEIRVPFLDYRLVERLAHVHPSEKFEGGWTKAIFRKAIAGLVPREIQYRRDKKGFNVPEEIWMRSTFVPRLRRAFAEDMMAEQLGMIDGAELRGAYEGYVRRPGLLSGRPFFRVHAFELFLRRYASYVATN